MTLMYLEDYLELVSFLPQEFKDRLTKVRELDLEASNRRDNIERLKGLLRKPVGSHDSTSHASGAPTIPDRVALTAEINSEYDKVVQLGVEKVKIVSGLEELMLRYNRRLTADTEKFKLELEADNPGITESLEARAELEMKNYRENASGKVSSDAPRVPSSRRVADIGLIMALRKQTSQTSSSRPITAKPAATPIDPSQTSRRINAAPGGGAGMLARAASQAIAATQQMQHGRRTASMKASYEAALKSTGSRDQSTDRVEPVQTVRSDRKRNSRRKTDIDGETEPAGDVADEDKELYCFCKQPSFGFMVACDNPQCPIEWFHGSCVGLQDSGAVEGQNWYCIPCIDKLNLRKAKPMKAGPGLKTEVSSKLTKKSRKPH